MNNADGDRQFNTDMEQHKEGVLRAKDIIPPLQASAQTASASSEADKTMPTPPIEVKTSVETGQRGSEIPRFNLAEEIMAEHRRITAVRRKGPGQTQEAHEQAQESELVSDTSEHISAKLSEQEQIIEEIVARDIEKLCRGDNLRQHKD